LNVRLFPRTTRRFRPASAPDNSACNSPIQQTSKPGPHRTGKRKRGHSSIDIPMSIGFSEEANLDEGAMWPTAFALKELTAAEEARIGALVKKAVS